MQRQAGKRAGYWKAPGVVCWVLVPVVLLHVCGEEESGAVSEYHI
jgi:hypothetical protein